MSAVYFANTNAIQDVIITILSMKFGIYACPTINEIKAESPINYVIQLAVMPLKHIEITFYLNQMVDDSLNEMS